MLRNKKALSPIVASIIIIAVTVAVSIAVAAWMGRLDLPSQKPKKLVTLTLGIPDAFNATHAIYFFEKEFPSEGEMVKLPFTFDCTEPEGFLLTLSVDYYVEVEPFAFEKIGHKEYAVSFYKR